jgi:hypothetical protein
MYYRCEEKNCEQHAGLKNSWENSAWEAYSYVEGRLIIINWVLKKKCVEIRTGLNCLTTGRGVGFPKHPIAL